MRKLFLPIVIIYYIFLYWYSINFLSFSIFEAKSVESFKLLQFFMNYIYNDYTLRLLPLSFSLFSLILYFKISEFYIFKYRYFSALIFMLIPGFIISSLIVNKAIFLIFFTLLFIYMFKKARVVSYILLISYVFIDYSFISLYFSLIFYAIYKKDSKLLIFSLFLMAVNANYFDYTIKGKPKGYFLDVIGTYILIFSPLVFVYFIYTLYKGFFLKKDILFFVGAFSFLLSIILSFRQRIRIDDYAPFVLPYLVYMIKVFLNSYKVRLSRFRLSYKILFVVLFFSMIIFDIGLFFTPYTSARDITKSFYFVKNLASFLIDKNIENINCNNHYLCKALNFYGVLEGDKYYLYYSKSKNQVSIFHKEKKVLNINVSNLNTLKK